VVSENLDACGELRSEALSSRQNQSSFMSRRSGSSVKSSYVRNDDEQRLIQAVLSPFDHVQPMQYARNLSKITLEANLVTDPSKNIQVEVKVGDKISTLLVIIGDQMKSS